MQKWLVKYKDRAVGIGDTIPEALAQALLSINKAKYIWQRQ